jgi:hypothetical protein
MVDSHIRSKYGLEIGSNQRQGMGPFEGSIQRTRNGELETVYGWEVHVWFSNDEHYLVLIRDGKIVESKDCGSMSGGFGLLNFRKPTC